MAYLNINSISELEQNQHLLDNHAIVSVADKHGNITYVNDKFCDITGYKRDEIIGQNHSQIRSDQHTAEFYRDLWQTISSGQTWSGKICNCKKNGEYYWVQTTIAPFLDSEGIPYKYVSYRTDITEVKKQEQIHRDLLNSMAEGIHGLDRNGICTFVNPAAEKMLGYDEEELVGQRLHDLIHHQREDGSLLLESDCNVFKTIGDQQDRRQCDDWFIRKDGSGFPIELTIVPRYEHGHFVGALLSYHDITSRKIADDKLKQSEERLSIAIAGANDGIWDWNITTDEVQFSQLYAEMLGYDQQELIPHVNTWIASVHPDDLERVQANLQNYLNGEIEKYESEFRLKCKDGNWKWILSRGKTIFSNSEKEPTRMTGIHTDISSRKEMEQELQQAKEYAEKANQAKSEFLSSMSHELRTPLNAIMGFSQLLLSDPQRPLVDCQENSVNHILNGGKHLLSLINEVLELSAIESGKLELSIESLSLNRTIDDVISLTRTLAEQQNIKIQALTDAEIFVHADQTKLTQILLNLISNAIKYNRDGGSVSIDWFMTKNNLVQVNIIDTGIGISDANQLQLFSAFNRLGQESSDIEGSGIGLVVTKGLVDLMGGCIGFESKAGKGSTFWFELPISLQTNMDIHNDDLSLTQSIETGSFNLGSKEMRHILYVEDNPANSEFMQTYFNRIENIHLHIAETAELGLEKMATHSFDLILMDINLPGIDGITLTKRMRAQQDFQHLPIIAITANAMPQDVEKSNEVFDAYITKPIDLSILTDALQKHL